MAFNLASRFPPPKDMDECIFGPGAYQNQMCQVIPKNKAPFNSTASRDAGAWKPYTEQLYSPVLKHHIPNCAAFMSKKPRFPYEALSKEDIEKLICRCSMECECPLEGDVLQPKKEEVCQKEVPRKLIVGRPPKSIVLGGLSSKPETSETEVQELGETSPPFYDTKVFETTTFYHGCKWSQRTAKRFQKNIEELEKRPGPNAYTIDPAPREDVLCAEKIRFLCRKASKQPRLADILQDLEIRHGGPGPAAYLPVKVNRNAVSVFGPKSDRFKTNKYDISPGPADYNLKGQFDLPEPPTKFSFARLPPPSFFGTRAPRFKSQDQQVGPGPSDYLPKGNLCRIQHCVEGAPFGTSAPRFKTRNIDDEYIDDESEDEDKEQPEKDECKQASWMFRSTSRRGDKISRSVEPKSVECPPETKYITLFLKKKTHNQHIAPFQTSEARFLPWNDWVSVYGRLTTPGPGTYSIEKPKCYHPAVCRGPLYRAPKTSFFVINDGPAPNARNISRGLNIKTFNLRLQNNESKRKSYKWVPPKDPRKLTLEEKESLLLKQSIALLDDTSVLENKTKHSKTSVSSDIQIKPRKSVILEKSKTEIYELKKPKLLRCFIGPPVHCH